jgi:hypothetical protein
MNTTDIRPVASSIAHSEAASTLSSSASLRLDLQLFLFLTAVSAPLRLSRRKCFATSHHCQQVLYQYKAPSNIPASVTCDVDVLFLIVQLRGNGVVQFLACEFPAQPASCPEWHVHLLRPQSNSRAQVKPSCLLAAAERQTNWLEQTPFLTPTSHLYVIFLPRFLTPII